MLDPPTLPVGLLVRSAASWLVVSAWPSWPGSAPRARLVDPVSPAGLFVPGRRRSLVVLAPPGCAVASPVGLLVRSAASWLVVSAWPSWPGSAPRARLVDPVPPAELVAPGRRTSPVVPAPPGCAVASPVGLLVRSAASWLVVSAWPSWPGSAPRARLVDPVPPAELVAPGRRTSPVVPAPPGCAVASPVGLVVGAAASWLVVSAWPSWPGSAPRALLVDPVPPAGLFVPGRRTSPVVLAPPGCAVASPVGLLVRPAAT
ncbi:hypothetical protein C1I92_23630 [Jiangella anatolica]|uniref:Uncharacterized protein n=1 Tax=Jiangella anatolica TaxID=2670374 RepID=A0A2W2BZ20_9ACTN|nr:hypothetical protein C1I92_23630 [Jiangella anatolica]